MRSLPLVIDKSTGEPKYLPHTYQKYEPWKVVILDIETQQRKSKKFFSYPEAKTAAEKIQEKLGPEYMVHVVSRQMGYGPPYSKITDAQLLRQNEMGRYWCPYCRTFRRFLYNAWREKRMCEFCQTVENDFHVIANNPTFWSSDKVKELID